MAPSSSTLGLVAAVPGVTAEQQLPWNYYWDYDFVFFWMALQAGLFVTFFFVFGFVHDWIDAKLKK